LIKQLKSKNYKVKQQVLGTLEVVSQIMPNKLVDQFPALLDQFEAIIQD
jgi:hypothetical protein